MHDLSFPRSASASDANRPIRSNLLAGFVRYLRHRRDDLWGRHDRIQTMNAWIVERICPSSRRPVPSNAARAAPHPSWTEVVAGRGLTADSLRRRYEAEATPARAFLVAALLSGSIHAHRLWRGDWSGACASLGAFLILLSLALPLACRCWQIRARALESPRVFLRHPSRWWPSSLPDDYQP